MTQRDLVIEFFSQNPNKEIEHKESVPWLSTNYKNRTNRPFRDPDRAIRRLYQEGVLIKVKKGTYKYHPKHSSQTVVRPFSRKQKHEILKRDNHRCVICGQGKEEGLDLHVDHIKPIDRGGKSTIDNGQTLCSQHNFFKKNFSQTETGKRMFIRLREVAKKNNQLHLIAFIDEVLSVYNKYGINDHIDWNK